MTEYETARERAGAALAEFRRRIPLMTGFARSFSGNKRVQIKPSGSGSYTDGDTLHLEVPLKLADKVKHNYDMCGEWDSQGFQMCPACAIVDDLNYQLFHEISHIWGGSFEKPSEWGRHELKRVVEQVVPKEMIGDASFILQDKGNDTWLKLAYGIHPFIKELANCFEDARVNTKMAQVRPGVRAWRRAFERRLMIEGIRRFDPRTNEETTFNPADAPLNAQMAYSLYFLAAGESVPQGMDKYVVKQLADPRVAELMREAVGNLEPEKPVQFAVRAYMLMADMGFFGNQDKLQQEQDDQGAPENAGEDEEGQPEESEGDGGSGEDGSPETDEDSDVESYSSEDESEGDGDDSQSTGDSESPGSDSEESGDAEESGDDGESSGGSGTEPSDDGEASDGDAENPSEDAHSGEADSAHEGEDNPGAGGESEADELDDESTDESSDGSNPGEAGEGAPEDAEGEASEGDEASDGSGADSLGEGGGSEAEDVNDPDGSGEVSDAEGGPDAEGGADPEAPGDGDSGSSADEETGSEGDGPGASSEPGEDGEDGPDAHDGGDDSQHDAGVDDGTGDESDSESSNGGDESGDSDASDESEGGSSSVGEDDADAPDQDENLGTGQPGDSAEGEPGDGQDGQAGDGDGASSGGDDLEDPDGDEVGDGEPVDRPEAGVDEDSDGKTSGESDGNEGTHGEGGSSSGIDGQGTSQLSDDDVAQSADEPEEADVAPEESQDDTPDRDADWGDAQEVHERLEDLFGHHPPNEDELREVIEELERAVNIGDVFDAIPRNVSQVWWNRWQKHYVHPTYGDQATSWTHKISSAYWFYGWTDEKMGIAGDFRVPDTILGKALLRARRAFADNARKKDVRHLKSGRVNARALGKRAPIHDPRLFKKINRPGKRDYFVVIGIDLSASNVYAPPKEYGKPEEPTNLALAKRAAMAQCEILARLGVKFAVYGHSCKGINWDDFAVNMYVVKEAHEPWNEPIRHRLEKLGPDEGNLDGHTLQIYRKVAEGVPATDKIVMYYTDGEIPAANGEEEGEVLLQQIERCKKENITLMGVGIRTDSLGKFGFDYTRVDTDEDLHRVVDNLERRLAE